MTTTVDSNRRSVGAWCRVRSIPLLSSSMISSMQMRPAEIVLVPDSAALLDAARARTGDDARLRRQHGHSATANITNCSIESSKIEIQATGAAAASVQIDPASPSAHAAQARHRQQTPEDLISSQRRWNPSTMRCSLSGLRGCVDHVVDMPKTAPPRGSDCCHELEIDDCPGLRPPSKGP